MRKNTEERVIEVAKYIVDNKATNSQTADYFNISKSCIKSYITDENKLKSINYDLYMKVRKVKKELQKLSNKKGGQITRDNIYKTREDKMITIMTEMVNNNLSLSDISIKYGEPISKLMKDFEKVQDKKLLEKVKKLY